MEVVGGGWVEVVWRLWRCARPLFGVCWLVCAGIWWYMVVYGGIWWLFAVGVVCLGAMLFGSVRVRVSVPS